MTVEMWYERHLRLRANYSAQIRFLLWVGLVKIGRKSAQIDLKTGEYTNPEQIIWPFSVPPLHIIRYCLKCKGQRIYRFRNLPGVIKYVPGRLLPLRWGFGILGFEFGDRGG